jgi:L-malate glycosyltransferase
LNRLHSWTLSHVARVIAVSGAVARALQSQHIFPADKIVVISNGIDLHRFDKAALSTDASVFRRSLGVAPERLLVGMVGEINQLKGQVEFLRAASLLARDFPTAAFVIAGEDFSRTGEHRARILKLISELKLDARVHLTGWLKDVAPLLHALDVFVSASHTESFGLAIVEALASGVPVIATATEGAREILLGGETGLLVPINDTGQLAAAIARLLGDTAERERLGARGRAAALERFSLEQMVSATELVYSAALARQ